MGKRNVVTSFNILFWLVGFVTTRCDLQNFFFSVREGRKIKHYVFESTEWETVVAHLNAVQVYLCVFKGCLLFTDFGERVALMPEIAKQKRSTVGLFRGADKSLARPGRKSS